mgnify:CR=1 FL=1
MVGFRPCAGRACAAGGSCACMAHPRHERARRGLPMDRLSRRGARRNPDLNMQTCEAVRSAPALPGDGSEVRRANVILGCRASRVQRYKQEPRRRSSERDTDARVGTDFSKMLGWLQLCFSPEYFIQGPVRVGTKVTLFVRFSVHVLPLPRVARSRSALV